MIKIKKIISEKPGRVKTKKLNDKLMVNSLNNKNIESE